jgi:hypothetical protein
MHTDEHRERRAIVALNDIVVDAKDPNGRRPIGG